jgi:hypothetical protein
VDYPDDRVIAWVVVRGNDGTEKRIPLLRDPKTPEELALNEQAKRILQKAQDQQDAQRPESGRQRRHRKQRLRQFYNRLRGNPPG